MDGGFHGGQGTWHCRLLDNRNRDLYPCDRCRILFVGSLDMQTFIYRCPITGFRVQGQAPESTNEGKGEHFEAVTCTACKRVHLVNPKTGKLISERDK
jgi:hypothetical protein